MSEFEKRGYKCGLQCAGDNWGEVQQCKSNIAISKLAAEKMDWWIKSSKDWWCNEPVWRIGFWSGFMSRAEELNKEDKGG